MGIRGGPRKWARSRQKINSRKFWGRDKQTSSPGVENSGNILGLKPFFFSKSKDKQLPTLESYWVCSYWAGLWTYFHNFNNLKHSPYTLPFLFFFSFFKSSKLSKQRWPQKMYVCAWMETTTYHTRSFKWQKFKIFFTWTNQG